MAKRVRAIIIRQNKILLIKRIKPNKTYWVFPGGGIEKGETTEQALIREIKEESGLDIKVKDLFLERSSDKPGMEDITEYFFTSDIVGGKFGSGKGPEYEPNSNYQGEYKLEWINIADLPKINLKSEEVKDLLIKKYEKNLSAKT